MKTETSPAIIMRIREFGESDLLVSFFTPDRGQLKGVAKGARRSSKRFVNCLDLFNLVSLEYGLKREGADLHFIHSGKLVNAFEGLRKDFSKLSAGSYMIELTETLFPVGVADRGMFDLLKTSFSVLADQDAGAAMPILFEVKAMALGGYRIHLESCCICRRTYTGQGTAVFNREKGGIACLRCQQASKVAPAMGPNSVRMIERILSTPLSQLSPLTFSEEMIHEIKEVLKLHREHCLGKTLKTCKYVE